MNWEAILNGLWQALNSVPGIMLLAALLGWLLSKLYSFRPAWEAYEGTIISAIKYAETAIPDDAQNKALKRLDEALRYALKVYAETHKGKQPPEALANDIREGIQIVHDRLEAKGTL